MIDVVLFDLDGTLIDHESAARRAVVEWSVAQGWNQNAAEDEISEHWDVIAERNFERHRRGELSFQGQRRQRMREFLPFVGKDPTTLSDDALDEAFAGYLDRYEAAWRPFDDARPALERLRDRVRLAILSNGDQAQQLQKLRAAGLEGLFESIMTSSLLGVSKPDVRAFERACEALETPVERVLYVGDRPTVDAIPAMEAGLHAVLVARSGDPGPMPEGIRVIRSLAELELPD